MERSTCRRICGHRRISQRQRARVVDTGSKSTAAAPLSGVRITTVAARSLVVAVDCGVVKGQGAVIKDAAAIPAATEPAGKTCVARAAITSQRLTGTDYDIRQSQRAGIVAIVIELLDVAHGLLVFLQYRTAIGAITPDQFQCRVSPCTHAL